MRQRAGLVADSIESRMPPEPLDTVTPRTEPIPGDITAVNSTKHRESEERRTAKTQRNSEKNETAQEPKNYKIGPFEFRTELKWSNIIGYILLHIGIVYALFTFSFVNYKMLTLWVIFTDIMGGFGVTGGVHRFWTHRSYKGNLALRIVLLICYLLAGTNSVYDWVRDHRVHHKYTETDADPHNSSRGFFFSHIGWLMMKKHPEVLRRGKQIDMSDILEDPLLQYSEKHFKILKLITCFILPVIIPVYCWNEEWYPTILSQWFIRYPFTLHTTWSVNSFAHIWGARSYDKSIAPSENTMVAFLTGGEGFHNYHHVFPSDYKAAELGNYRLNITTMIIDGFAKIGWAYDLKRTPDGLVQKVVENRGDGSHCRWGKCEK